jgi:photosystem II stability/assembly factor-like uncharacterized protein
VKPSNILLSDNEMPFLSDFGLSKIMAGDSERLTLTGTVLGTPEYMSPEQCMGSDITAAADIYSLGVIAYEMLTSKVPFSAPTPAAVILAQLQAALPIPQQLNPSIPPRAQDALLRVLAKNPSDRYPTAMAFIDELSSARTPVAAAAPPGQSAESNRAIGVAAATTAEAQAKADSIAEPVPSAPTVGQPVAPRPSLPKRGPLSKRARVQIGAVAVGVICALAAALWLGVPWLLQARDAPALTSVSCPTATACYAVGETGAFYRSDDGGQSWRGGEGRVACETSGCDSVYSITCSSASMCIVVPGSFEVNVSRDVAPAGSGSVYYTTDNGLHWGKSHALGVNIEALACPSAGHCVSVGAADEVGITSDAGKTWTSRPWGNKYYDKADMQGISCPDATHCVVVGRSQGLGGTTWGVIVASADGGETWTIPKEGAGLFAQWGDGQVGIGWIGCASSASCVAIAAGGCTKTRGYTVVTSDGANWSEGDCAVEPTALTCPAANTCYLLEGRGVWAATSPYSDWQRIGQIPTTGGPYHGDPYSLSCTSSSDCVAVGEGGSSGIAGYAWKTTDGAKHWTTIRIPGG